MRRSALLVAIDKYPHSGISHLDFAERDARVLADVLRADYGFETRTLLGPEAKPDAVRAMLSTGRLHPSGPMSAPLAADDQFLFFFSGHGQLISGSYVLHLWKAAPGTFGGGLTANDLRNLLAVDLPCRECVVILDACRDLGLPGAKGPGSLDPASSKDIRTVARPPQTDRRVELLYGCGEGERSWEDPTLVWPNDTGPGGHGVLTYNLIRALREAHAEAHVSFVDIANRTGDLMAEWRHWAGGEIRQMPWLDRIPSSWEIQLRGVGQPNPAPRAPAGGVEPVGGQVPAPRPEPPPTPAQPQAPPAMGQPLPPGVTTVRSVDTTVVLCASDSDGLRIDGAWSPQPGAIVTLSGDTATVFVPSTAGRARGAFTLAVWTQSADVRGDAVCPGKIETMSGDIDLVVSARIDVQASSMSGKVQVVGEPAHRAEAHAPALVVTSLSGDITIRYARAV